MKVAVAYVDLHPLADAALQRHTPDAQRYQLGPHPDAYWQFFASMWSAGEGWLNIEQDVEVHEDVVPQLEACDQHWCAFPYMGGLLPGSDGDGHIYVGLGCTRFSTQLIQAEPDLLESLPIRTWQLLDCHIHPELLKRGYAIHQHWPEPKHHHIYHSGYMHWCACGADHDTASV